MPEGHRPVTAPAPDEIEDSPSARLFERAKAVMPGGCSRNTVLRKPYPLYAARGEGCYIIDIAGTRRIDFANNMASLIHGHAAPGIVDAVKRQVSLGTGYTMATEVEIEYAEHMVARVPAFDKIRFVNSGTEAVMSVIKASRACTGRRKIAKVEGAYHGLYDYAEVSQTSNPGNWGSEERPESVPVAYGTPPSALDEVIVIPFNDFPRAETILEKFRDELACVLIDLVPHRVGMIPATGEFLTGLREWTRRNNVLLACDEVITFRCDYRGAQTMLGVEADLTALGKMIGGGFPVGAVAGRDEVMRVLDPLADRVLFPHSGTFSANPVTMVAGKAAMEAFDQEAVLRLNELGQLARRSLTEAAAVADFPASVTGVGSMFRIHMAPKPPQNYRQVFPSPAQTAATQMFLDYMVDHGILLINTCSGMLSTPMESREIDILAETAVGAFRHARQALA
ncbi:MAG: aspartate aminotransferase family protein [Woeseiaceae bacterium]|nr:aspartate aminotransferase family protein [Woeseiaceae bacterium]